LSGRDLRFLKKPLSVLLTLGLGVLVGSYLSLTSAVDDFINYLLLALIFAAGVLIGYDLESSLIELRRNVSYLLLPVATMLGSITSGLLIHLITNAPLNYVLATVAGMGWYTFTGSYIAALNPYYGFIAYTSNILREVYTFLTYHVLHRRLGIKAIAAGGATTMDTTLPLIMSVGGSKAGVMAFLHGFIITLLVPVIVPALAHLNT